MTPDTIFALSSGAPPCAIAVIRISGPLVRSTLATIAPGGLPAPRRGTRRRLVNPSDSTLLDDALVLRFEAPASATGEDVAELHVHGGRATIAAILAVLGDLPGLRAAEAGEFTRRALENGRIDLTAAEGLADLLAAETEHQRRAALDMAVGGLAASAAGWRDRLLQVSAEIEAGIEFEDEADVAATDEIPWASALAAIIDEMHAVLAAPSVDHLRDGFRVVIAGPPNAGKSSLFNKLVQYERAIVSAKPGTTRDSIEVRVDVQGYPLIFVDTAGLRAVDDDVEGEGIRRSRSELERSDIILWLGEASEAPDRVNVLRVFSKCDVRSRDIGYDHAVSSRTGEGCASLITAIAEIASTMVPRVGEVSANQRQRIELTECIHDLTGAQSLADPLLVAAHVGRTIETLSMGSRDIAVEEMLDKLFSQFCIGK